MTGSRTVLIRITDPNLEFNLPTLFFESEDLTNYEFDVDDFKYSDLFDENGEVYADTLWSSVDHRATTV